MLPSDWPRRPACSTRRARPVCRCRCSVPPIMFCTRAADPVSARTGPEQASPGNRQRPGQGVREAQAGFGRPTPAALRVDPQLQLGEADQGAGDRPVDHDRLSPSAPRHRCGSTTSHPPGHPIPTIRTLSTDRKPSARRAHIDTSTTMASASSCSSRRNRSPRPAAARGVARHQAGRSHATVMPGRRHRSSRPPAALSNRAPLRSDADRDVSRELDGSNRRG